MLRRLRICLAALALAAVPVLAWAPGRAYADGSVYLPNWSGYMALSPPATPFGYSLQGFTEYGWGASASWVQPAGNCTSTKTAVASIWVGLGNYSGASGPVEQAGTDTDCSGGSPVYYAWYATSFTSQVTYGGAISAGDSMSSYVMCFSGSCNLWVWDRTAGWNADVTTPLSGTPTSSEVVVTRPKSGTVPLTNFGTVNFNQVAFGGGALASSYNLAQIPGITNSAGIPLDSISALGGLDSTTNTYFSATWLRSS